jgi:hypothetical protein
VAVVTMGFFDALFGGDGANGGDGKPDTISDKEWARIQKGAAKSTPAIDGPWVDAKTTRRTEGLRSAKQNAKHN